MGDILYQHGTLGTLMAGLLEGTATIQDILKQGDAGLGTLAGSDGEVIFIDGQAFHANAQNEFTQLTGEELTLSRRSHDSEHIIRLKRPINPHNMHYHRSAPKCVVKMPFQQSKSLEHFNICM